MVVTQLVVVVVVVMVVVVTKLVVIAVAIARVTTWAAQSGSLHRPLFRPGMICLRGQAWGRSQREAWGRPQQLTSQAPGGAW